MKISDKTTFRCYPDIIIKFENIKRNVLGKYLPKKRGVNGGMRLNEQSIKNTLTVRINPPLQHIKVQSLTKNSLTFRCVPQINRVMIVFFQERRYARTVMSIN